MLTARWHHGFAVAMFMRSRCVGTGVRHYGGVRVENLDTALFTPPFGRIRDGIIGAAGNSRGKTAEKNGFFNHGKRDAVFCDLDVKSLSTIGAAVAGATRASA